MTQQRCELGVALDSKAKSWAVAYISLSQVLAIWEG